MTYEITEEQLNSLTSDFMTVDTRMIIADAVRNQEAKSIQPTSNSEQQAIGLGKLYRWIQYNSNDEGSLPQHIWENHQVAFGIICRKIVRLQDELTPDAQYDSINGAGYRWNLCHSVKEDWEK